VAVLTHDLDADTVRGEGVRDRRDKFFRAPGSVIRNTATMPIATITDTSAARIP
jgi:hypothetical protein